MSPIHLPRLLGPIKKQARHWNPEPGALHILRKAAKYTVCLAAWVMFRQSSEPTVCARTSHTKIICPLLCRIQQTILYSQLSKHLALNSLLLHTDCHSGQPPWNEGSREIYLFDDFPCKDVSCIAANYPSLFNLLVQVEVDRANRLCSYVLGSLRCL